LFIYFPPYKKWEFKFAYYTNLNSFVTKIIEQVSNKYKKNNCNENYSFAKIKARF